MSEVNYGRAERPFSNEQRRSRKRPKRKLTEDHRLMAFQAVRAVP